MHAFAYQGLRAAKTQTADGAAYQSPTAFYS